MTDDTLFGGRLAWFRYGVIAPLLAPEPGKTLKERIDEQSSRLWTLPDGRVKSIGFGTIEKWLYDYRQGGVDALQTRRRSDAGVFRGLDGDMAAAIDRLLAEHPKLLSLTPDSFSYARLYGDAAYHKTAPVTVTLSGPGIDANAVYRLRFFAFDNYDPEATAFKTGKTVEMVCTPINGTSGSSVSVFYDLINTTPADNYTYSAAGLFTSSSSGELAFSFGSVTSGYPRAYLNGLVLNVPEPLSFQVIALFNENFRLGVASLSGVALRETF